MDPSLLPDLAHLPVLVTVSAVAALCVGLGVWVGARRAETALIAGWGVGCCFTVVIGTLTDIGLSHVMMALALAGFAGLVRIGITRSRGSSILRCATAGRVIVLALPFLACIESMEPVGTDDYLHWLPNLAYLCTHDHFPSLAEPSGSYHAAYPYALALPGFAVFLLLGRVAGNAALLWNFIAMLAVGASIASVFARCLAAGYPDLKEPRAFGWGSAAFGLLIAGLACPTFVPKIFFSNMADAATGSILAVAGSLLFDWVGAPVDRRPRIAVVAAFVCVALVDVRQASAALFGLLILGCVAGYALAEWRRQDRPGPAAVRSLGILLPLPLLVLSLWGHYAATQIPGGEFTLLPFALWHWAVFPQTLHSMLRVFFAKAGLSAVTLFISIRAALSFRLRDDIDPPARALVGFAVAVTVGNIVFLALAYLAVGFKQLEAATATSFWRYMSEVGPLATLGAVAGLPSGWLRRLTSVPSMAALITVAVVLPLATVKLYRFDLQSPVPRLHRMAAAIEAAVPRSASLELVDLTGNGFAPLIVYYDLVLSGREHALPARTVTELSDDDGISAEKAAGTNFNRAQYIWLAEGAPEMTEIFGPELSARCSYLLRRGSDTFAVVARWPIGPYRWGTYRNGWSDAGASSCD